MATNEANPSHLSIDQRQKIETWLVQFRNTWNQDLLAEWARKLPGGASPLRRSALIEMVKIDMSQRASMGEEVSLDWYLQDHPEVGTKETVPLELIHEEYELRHAQGHDLSEYAERFPQRFEELRRYIEGASEPHHPRTLIEEPARPRTVDEAVAAAAGFGTLKPEPSLQGLSRLQSAPAVATDEPHHPRTVVEQQQAIVGTAFPAPTTHGSAPAGEGKSLPKQFGRYLIEKKLGEGGMGAVYLAHDTQLDRAVALKIPLFQANDGPELLERFIREARTAATLRHPNLCPVYDVGAIDGTHFITMAYIEGSSLADLLRQGMLPEEQALDLTCKIAMALEEAHQKGIVHRDLKPANIMITPRGEPVIMDFGLARRTNTEDVRLTKSGTIMGTPAYMSPEQVLGRPEAQGPSCDIYTLGVILFELLTGRLPFKGDVTAMLAQIISEKPPAPSSIQTHLSDELDSICFKALAKEPGKRFQSMAAFATCLGNVSGSGLPRTQTYVAQEPRQATPTMHETPGTDAPPRTVVERSVAIPPQTGENVSITTIAIFCLVLLASAGGGWAFLHFNGPKSTTAEEHYSRGVNLLKERKLDDAIKEFDTTVRLDPTMIAAFNARSDAYFDNYELDKSINDASEVMRLDPKSARAYCRRAGAYLFSGLYDKAIADCDEAIRLDPEMAQAYAYRGFAYSERSDDKDQVRSDCKKALQLDPDNALALLLNCELRGMGNYQASIADCDAALRMDDRMGIAYAQRSCLHYLLGDKVKSMNDFDLAMKFSPKEPMIYQIRGGVFTAKKEFDLALASYAKAIEIAPKFPGAYSSRGLTYTLIGKFDQALADTTEAIRLNDKAVSAYTTRGTVYNFKKDFDSAIADCSRAISINPKYEVAYITRAVAYKLNGDLEKSDKDLAMARKLIPNFDKVASDSINLVNSGATPKPPKSTTKNQDPEALFSTGKKHADDGNYKEALRYLDAAIRLDPHKPRYYDYRGVCYDHMSNRQAAIEEFSKAIEVDPTWPNAYKNRAIVYRKLGDSNRALRDEKKYKALKQP